MKPDKLKKLVETGGVTNDKDLAIFEVADELSTKLDTLSEAQKGTTQAIKDIPQQSIPEYPNTVEISNFPLEEKEVLIKNLPNIQKVEITNHKKDSEREILVPILEDIYNKIETVNLSPVVEAVKAIEKSEPFVIPEDMITKSGRLKVAVDKVGEGGYRGGGGSISGPLGLKNVATTPINPATEDKQDDIITEIGKLVGFEIPANDYIALTYVASGDGVGEIETVVYKEGGSGGTTVGTLTLAYNASNELSSVTKT